MCGQQGAELKLSGKNKLEYDKLLMDQVKRGDRDAEQKLLVHLWRRVSNMTRYMSPYKQEAEDLTQEVLIEILKSSKSYEAEGCVEAWADVIAVRTILKRLRRHHRLRQLLVFQKSDKNEIDEYEIVAADDNVEDAFHRKALLNQVIHILRKLKPDERSVVVLKLVYGFSVLEISEMMEKRPESIKYLLQKGKGDLKRLAFKDVRLKDLVGGWNHE